MRRNGHAFTDELRVQFEGKKSAIRARLRDFASVPPAEYFYELVYCLLTPQSSAENAGEAVAKLRAMDFVNRRQDPTPVLRAKTSYIRFHNTKARRLLEARTRMGAIMEALQNGCEGEQLREWLVGNVKGLGWKEASHFLRNIGHRNLAILDRHILRNLMRHRVIRSMPKSLPRAEYMKIEKKFRAFAAAAGISMDELDLLFWSMETGKILK
jgi:N-glycosylase/DNA lyase